MKPKISTDELRGRLTAGAFRGTTQLPRPSDPVVETPIEINIDQIKAYDENPRNAPNPAYDEIRESIRITKRLNNPFTVTRKPGTEFYIPEAGGNTRYQILKELWDETQDPVFYKVKVIFRPWISDISVLQNHLIENDQRGDLMFIDKALGYLSLKKKIEKENGTTLSQREYVEYLNRNGFPRMERRSFRRMNDATELLAFIPRALRGGIGPSHIDQIADMRAVHLEIWKKYRDESAFENFFNDFLQKNDADPFVISEISKRLSDALSAEIAVPNRDVHTASKRAPIIKTTKQNRVLATQERVIAAVERKHEDKLKSLFSEPNERDSEDPLDQLQGCPDYEEKDCGRHIGLLRETIYKIALQLAERAELNDSIFPAGFGLGFYIDLPMRPLPINTHPTGEHRSLVWWLLLASSEQSVNTSRLKLLPIHSRFRNAILGTGPNEIEAFVGKMPSVPTIGYLFFNDSFTDEGDFDLQTFVKLTNNCRQLRLLSQGRLARDNDSEFLWGGSK